MNENIILNHLEIEHKIRRIAFQIYETFADEQTIIIAGIASNGYEFAKRLGLILSEISTIEIILCEVKVDKENPNSEISTSIPSKIYQNKGVVLVDDVLNSGTTLIYAIKHFLEVPLTKLKTAVLIDRNHKKYPVKVDFKGISLSTSLQEHVSVVFENQNNYAFLS